MPPGRCGQPHGFRFVPYPRSRACEVFLEKMEEMLERLDEKREKKKLEAERLAENADAAYTVAIDRMA